MKQVISRRSALVAVSLLGATFISACGGMDSNPDRESTFSEPQTAALDAALAKALEGHKVPGAVVGIWIPGEGSYVAAAGVSDVSTGERMRTDAHFRIGSNTKTFTVTVLLQLVDDGVLALDDKIGQYLSFVPNGQNITLRMLADMTSGLFSYTEVDDWVFSSFSEPQRRWAPRELVDVGLAQPPYFAPGTGWHYSNTNTVLLGMLIEQLTGKPIQTVLTERIFRPLGLTHTVWPTDSSLPTPYAHGITVQTLDGQQADATDRNPSWGYTAGQLVSTLADMKIWVESYTTGSLISPAMQQQRLRYVSFPPNTADKKYALGIGFDHGWLGHSGELPGYNTGGYYLPSRQATIVVLVNSDIAVGGINPMPAIFAALAAVVLPDDVPD